MQHCARNVQDLSGKCSGNVQEIAELSGIYPGCVTMFLQDEKRLSHVLGMEKDQEISLRRIRTTNSELATTHKFLGKP